MPVEVSFCVVNTEQRELLVRCLDAIAPSATRCRSSTEVLVLDNASNDGSAGAARAPPASSTEVIALRAAARQGRERHRAAPARPRALRAAAQRGLRAAARARPPRCTTALDRAPAGGGRGRALVRPDGAPAASRVALPDAGDRARRRGLPPPPADRAEPRRPDARGRLGAVRRAARARRGGRARSATSTRRSSSTPTRSTSASAWRRGLERRSTSPAPRPSTTSSSRPARCPSGGSSSSRATATATCASTTRAWRGARSSACSRRGPTRVRALAALVAARPRPAALLAPRAPRRCGPTAGEGLREAAVDYNRGRRL